MSQRTIRRGTTDYVIEAERTDDGGWMVLVGELGQEPWVLIRPPWPSINPRTGEPVIVGAGPRRFPTEQEALDAGERELESASLGDQ